MQATLSHYRILEQIGAGGMGVVYRAHDEHLDCDVALKVLPAGELADDAARKRFRKEALALSKLNHPNIAVVHDFDTQDGTDFLVEELIPGLSLSEMLISGPLPEREIINLGSQLAEGLQAAHQQGVIHRDLKPANIRVTPDGRLKILDFGLARVVQPYSPTALTVSETQTPVFAGTLLYMAPEQLLAEKVDPRTDIWAVGCVLHEMATGRPPFSGSGIALTDAILHQPAPAASKLNPGLSPGLEAIILKCLEKDSSLRYASARDIAVDLQRLKRDTDSGRAAGPVSAPAISAVTTPAQKRVRSWLLAASSAVVAFVVLLFVLNVGGLRDRVLGGKPSPTLNPKSVVVAIFENRTGDPSLDNLGKMTAESVSEGLLQIENIRVVPSSTVFGLPTGGVMARPARDPVRTLAEATGSGLVVSGAYYLQGQKLQIRATIMDAVANKPLYAVDPASGPREKATEAIESVRQRVRDVIAARYLNPYHDLLTDEVTLPSYQAQKELLAGDELFFSDIPAAIVHLKRAIELDPEFFDAHWILTAAYANQGNVVEAKTQLQTIARMQERLTPISRRRLDRMRTSARIEARYSIDRDIVKLAPDDPAEWLELGFLALLTNRPRETVEALRKPVDWSLVQKSEFPLGVLGFMGLTRALHELGEYEVELKEARRGRSVYPDLLNSYAYEVRALAAMARVAEVNSLVNQILVMPPHWGYPSCACVARGTPGYVMLSAAEELRAHNQHEASLKMASRAVEWYRSRTGEEAQREDTRSGLGDALYQEERWGEAKAVFSTLATEHPDNIFYKGRLGTLAARLGDRVKALRIAEELRRLDRPGLSGNHTFRSARIIALLGDKERAMALLREAVAQASGSTEEPESFGYALIYSHSMDLESLRDYPPFEELIKPKG